MANFSICNSTNGTQQAIAASSYASLCQVYCSTTGTAGLTRRGKVYDILIGTNGTPADNYIEWAMLRLTAPSTGALTTPLALDLADTAWGSGATVNSTTMPTLASTAMTWYVGVNQRASYRWVDRHWVNERSFRRKKAGVRRAQQTDRL